MCINKHYNCNYNVFFFSIEGMKSGFGLIERQLWFKTTINLKYWARPLVQKQIGPDYPYAEQQFIKIKPPSIYVVVNKTASGVGLNILN